MSDRGEVAAWCALGDPLATSTADMSTSLHLLISASFDRRTPGLHPFGDGGGGAEGVLLAQRLKGHKQRVDTCASHPLEAVLVTAEMDAIVRVWRAH